MGSQTEESNRGAEDSKRGVKRGVKLWKIQMGSQWLKEESNGESESMYHIVCTISYKAMKSYNVYIAVITLRGPIGEDWSPIF